MDLLQVKPNLNINPIYQVMLVLYRPEQLELALQEIRIKSLKLKYINERLDLIINVEEMLSGELSLSIEYNTDLFEGDPIERLVNHYIELLKVIPVQDKVINL